MSDFNADLNAQAYALVNGSIDLEDFKAWYKLAVVAQAPKQPAFVPPPKTERFTDYERGIDAPDEDMTEHHRKLLGSGEQE